MSARSSARGRLYHYTDAKGLIGIVQGSVLWATDAEFLNDAQELRFGRQEVHDALIARADELSPSEPPTEHSDYSDRAGYTRAIIMRSAAEGIGSGGMPGVTPWERQVVYVACFCEDGDLLSQWRAYAAGGGFAIGFSTSALREFRPVETKLPTKVALARDAAKEDIEEMPQPPPVPVQLERISYGTPAVESIITDVLDTIAPIPTGHPGIKGLARAQTVVLPALATVKHDAFEAEREWRLIVVASEGVERVSFNAGSLGVIPYIELDFEAAAIEEVVIGPGSHAAVRKRGVERLLTEMGLDVTVTHSRAPSRG